MENAASTAGIPVRRTAVSAVFHVAYTYVWPEPETTISESPSDCMVYRRLHRWIHDAVLANSAWAETFEINLAQRELKETAGQS